MSQRLPLDPELARLVVEAPEHLDLDPAASIDDVRGQARSFYAWLRGQTDPSLATVAIRDDTIEGVAVRWYGPDADSGHDLIAFLHGGGWTNGDLDSYDDDVRRVAQRFGATAVAVHYRRTPEHPFPAAIDDCESVVRALADVPHRALAVMGDSAGGNLAVATALSLGRRSALDAVLALFPVLDAGAFDNESYQENGTDYLLTREAMQLYWSMYATTAAARRDPRCSPAAASDLTGLPPFVIASADYDPLRDEARVFASRLVASDVDVTYLPGPGLIHGFQQMTPRTAVATRALDAAYDALAAAMQRGAARRLGTHTSAPS